MSDHDFEFREANGLPIEYCVAHGRDASQCRAEDRERPFPPTPELDKQGEIIRSGKAATVQEFYDWLTEQGYVLAKWDEESMQTLSGPEPRLFPAFTQPEQLMAYFFGIDRDKIEAERRALLDALRQAADS